MKIHYWHWNPSAIYALLLFIPIGSLICATVFYPLVKKSLRFQSVWFFSALGYGTHGLPDACTYGTQLLWPLTDLRFAWHNVCHRSPVHATADWLGSCVCLPAQPKTGGLWHVLGTELSGVWFTQHQRALVAAEQIVASRGHEPVRLEVKPGFANLLVWKVIYEYQIAITSTRFGSASPGHTFPANQPPNSRVTFPGRPSPAGFRYRAFSLVF